MVNEKLQQELLKDFEYFGLKTLGKDIMFMTKSERRAVLNEVDTNKDSYHINRGEWDTNWEYFKKKIYNF